MQFYVADSEIIVAREEFQAYADERLDWPTEKRLFLLNKQIPMRRSGSWVAVE